MANDQNLLCNLLLYSVSKLSKMCNLNFWGDNPHALFKEEKRERMGMESRGATKGGWRGLEPPPARGFRRGPAIRSDPTTFYRGGWGRGRGGSGKMLNSLLGYTTA
jgi:hypothetical protein